MENKKSILSNMQFELQGRIPPHSREIEEAVLGAIMLESDKGKLVYDFLGVNDFYVPEHEYIYEAILNLSKNGKAIDLLTINNELRNTGKLDLAGGSYYLAQLTGKVSSGANVEYHARVLTQKSAARQLIRLGGEMNIAGFNEQIDPYSSVLDAINKLSIILDFKGKRALRVNKIINESLKKIEAEQENPELKIQINTGLNDLDRLTGSFCGGDLIILAARPGMGKTAMALTFAKFNTDHKKAGLIFSLEMQNESLGFRVLTMESVVPVRKLRTSELNERDWSDIQGAMPRIDKMDLYIDDSPLINIYDLKTRSRREKETNDIKYILIDYLQLITTENAGNREQQISLISRELKALSKELNIPVIALAQLSRAVESREIKKPQLSDLRESGSIEQDADFVMFLYREKYYNKECEHNDTEVIVAKNRNGSPGIALVQFEAEIMKFSDKYEFKQSEVWDNSHLNGYQTERDEF